jgi:hypothetical protein
MHARFGRSLFGDEPILASLFKTVNVNGCSRGTRPLRARSASISTPAGASRRMPCRLTSPASIERTPTPRAHRRAECRSPLLRTVQSRLAARRGRIGLNAPLGGGLCLCKRTTHPRLQLTERGRGLLSELCKRLTHTFDGLPRPLESRVRIRCAQHQPSRRRLQPSKCLPCREGSRARHGAP